MPESYGFAANFTALYAAMLVLDVIVEKRIREAQERGEFDDLPGAGAPLEPEDNALVPPKNCVSAEC